MASILLARFPDKAPQLFDYLRTISRASRNFKSAVWASYDMAFRKQAANRGSLDWGVVDTALYNEAQGEPRSLPGAPTAWPIPIPPRSARNHHPK